MGSECIDGFVGVRCVFDHGESAALTKGSRVYEERVIVVRADTFDAAIEKAEVEAAEYCAELDGVAYLGLAQACAILGDFDFSGDAMPEVFSLMRFSPLGAEEYLTRFFDTGDEHQGAVEENSD